MRKVLLALGALAAVALIAVGATLIVDSIRRFSDARIEGTRTPVPGARDAELDAGKYVVYYEVDGSYSRGGDIPVPPLELTIRRGGDGPPLTLRRYSGSFRISGGNREATAVSTVRVPEDGSYRIRVGGRQLGAEPAVLLGRPIGKRVLRLILGLVAVVAGFVVGVLVTVLGIVLLVRHQRAARAEGS